MNRLFAAIAALFLLAPLFASAQTAPAGTNTIILWWNLAYDTAPSGWSVQDFLVKVSPIPTVDISVAPASITSGQSAVLSWTSTNAAGCTGTGFTPNNTSGSQSVAPTQTTTYAITCTSTGGSASASATLTVTPPLPPPDTQAPSVPTGLTGSAVSTSQINLSWNPSTDNVGVTGYTIYRNGTQAGQPTGTTFSDTGLTPATTYVYSVSAHDAAGNVSAQSTSASVTTQAPPPPAFGIGVRVKTTANLNVRAKPNNNKQTKILCTAPSGSLGTIASGPQSANGYTWWNVNFDTPVCDGWAIQSYLTTSLADGTTNNGPFIVQAPAPQQPQQQVAAAGSVDLSALQAKLQALLAELQHLGR